MRNKIHNYLAINDFIATAIEWNQNVDPSMDRKKIDVQKNIVTLSELQETLDAIKAFNEEPSAKNRLEIIDGVGDVLFTAGYYIFLTLSPHLSIDQRKEILENAPQGEINDEMINHLTTYDGEQDKLRSLYYTTELIRRKLVSYDNVTFYDLCLLCAQAKDYFGAGEFESYMDAILKSNNSKFIPESEWDELKEMKHIETKYGDEFDNIVFLDFMYNGSRHFKIVSDGGRGKLLKPSGYREPTAFLSIG